MYIDPYFAGVVSTVFVELVLMIGYAIYINWKKKG